MAAMHQTTVQSTWYQTYIGRYPYVRQLILMGVLFQAQIGPRAVATNPLVT